MANHPEVTQITRYVFEIGPFDAEARFSPDKRHRYQLHRWITSERRAPRTVAFVMLNPSTADAFKLDPTITKCVRMSKGWGFDRIDVVNLFSLRSPHPKDLHAALARREAITDDVNDAHILGVCETADLVIAAWGVNHFSLGDRGTMVRETLEVAGIELHHLGLATLGDPLHPLARGKNWIPYDRKPERWQ